MAKRHHSSRVRVSPLPNEDVMARWVCDYCGNEGHPRPGQRVYEVQCDMCGESVTPLD